MRASRVIWLNGTFGVGKSSTARVLAAGRSGPQVRIASRRVWPRVAHSPTTGGYANFPAAQPASSASSRRTTQSQSIPMTSIWPAWFKLLLTSCHENAPDFSARSSYRAASRRCR